MEEWEFQRDMPLIDDSKIPLEPERFYADFGPLHHPVTRQPVKKLADYQYDSWRKFLQHGKILEVKSHRVGESSKWLLVDFQLAVLPPSKHQISTRGYDTMVLGPTKQQAIEIVRDFRRRVLESKKYSPFILDKPDEVDESGELSQKAILRDEKTKTTAIYIKNPDDPLRPSRIIALGADNPGSLEAWPNFKHLHISDITATRGDYEESLNVALTRIANTNGTVVIETIPGAPIGPIYDWSRRYRGIPDPPRGDFLYVEVTAEQAVAAGVMPKEFLEGERRRLTVEEFNGLYMAQFSHGFGNVFSSEMIERAIQLGKELEARYGLLPRSFTEKSQGHDPGTYFGTCVLQKIDGVLQVILADENDNRDEDQELYDSAVRIKNWPIQTTQIDAAGAAFISSLKRRIREDPHYERMPKERHRSMKVKPISFSTDHRRMLQNLVILMQNGKIAISPKFDRLLVALRTAVAEDYSLDKARTLHNHVLDALRLAAEPYSVK